MRDMNNVEHFKVIIMKDLNLVELLRDCPTGMELDCLVFDNVTFDYVNTQQNRVYCKVDKSESVWFTPRGGVNLLPDAKCVIFPKGKTTWKGFVPPVDFKDGDVVAVTMKPEGIWTGIFKQYKETSFESHCCLNTIGEFDSKGFKNHSFIGLRYATEEEKQKLFATIKANGYKWNAETKTLEKLKTFKFDLNSIVKLEGTDICYRVVGQKLERRNGSIIEAEYKLRNLIDNNIKWINVADEDKYELVPNKFDISTLKPFDKVLVRNTNSELWRISLFGCFSNEERYFMCMANSAFYQCIPYNEDTKHLVGTTNDCDDFLKTWEK